MHYTVFVLCIWVITAQGQPKAADVDVFIKPINPDLPENPGLFVPEGANQTLDCYVRVNERFDVVSLYWDLPSTYIGANIKNKVKDNMDGTYTYHQVLHISMYDPSKHDGEYKCIYKDSDEYTTQAVIRAKSVKEIKAAPVYYYGNKTETLHCTVSQSSGASRVEFIEWIKGNQSITELQEKFERENPGKGKKYTVHENTANLVISQLNRDDADRYKARMKIESQHYDCIVDYTAGPLILDLDKSVNLNEDEDLVLDCEVKGFPRPDVTWWRGEERIVNSAHLELKQIKQDQKGTYKCQAYSKYFGETTEKTIIVRVKNPLSWLWPLIGIICEVILLVVVILLCEKFGKKDEGQPLPSSESPARRGHMKDN